MGSTEGSYQDFTQLSRGDNTGGQQWHRHTSFTDVLTRVNDFRKGFMYYDAFDEPTYLSFYVDFDFEGLMTDQLTGFSASPLFSTEETGMMQSAEKYLARNYGVDGMKVNKLREFKTILKYTANNAPWYFQSVNGVANLWKSLNSGLATGFRGDVELKFNCLEAIDMRMFNMASAYRFASYDPLYMRHSLPNNLKKFNMRVYIGEVRNIYTALQPATPNEGPIVTGLRDVTNKVISKSPDSEDAFYRFADYFCMSFDCYGCEFDFSESFITSGMDINASINAENRRMASMDFKVKVGRVEEGHKFGNGFVSEKLIDRYATDASTINAGRLLRDDYNLSSRNIAGETLTLGKIAEALGPLAGKSTSEVIHFENAVTNILNTPNKFVNGIIDDIRKKSDGGSFGNIYK